MRSKHLGGLMWLICFWIWIPTPLVGQFHSGVKTYVLDSVLLDVKGTLDGRQLLELIDLKVGQEFRTPGPSLRKSVSNLTASGLLDSIDISAVEILGKSGHAMLIITGREVPLVRSISWSGIGRTEQRRMNDWLKAQKIVAPLRLSATKEQALVEQLAHYYREDGFGQAVVHSSRRQLAGESSPQNLEFKVDQGPRTRIKNLMIETGGMAKEGAIRRVLHSTQEQNLLPPWQPSIYTSERLEEDCERLQKFGQSLGYLDVVVTSEVTVLPSSDYDIRVTVEPGRKYYFGKFSVTGNSVYPDSVLLNRVNHLTGQVYNPFEFESALHFQPDGTDLSGLYLDQGYFRFSVSSTPIALRGDTIDRLIRVIEGRPVTVGGIRLAGNIKTRQSVLFRELTVQSGDTFSRRDLVTSQNRLSALPYLRSDSIRFSPEYQPETDLLNLKLDVRERLVDRVWLDAGAGFGSPLVGTVGLTFQNFDLSRILQRKAWKPLPYGGGQQLDLQLQSTGGNYIGGSIDFFEPWLGGKRPNGLGVTGFFTRFDDDTSGTMMSYGGSVRYLPELRQIDPRLGLFIGLNYIHFDLNDFEFFDFTTGVVNNLNAELRLKWSNLPLAFYPTRGFELRGTFKATPPLHLNRSFEAGEAGDQDRFRWLSYHKTKLAYEHNFQLDRAGNLVLHHEAGFGVLGGWTRELGVPPVDRFYLGGTGYNLSNFDGREQIGLRGYPNTISGDNGHRAIARLSLELRYKLFDGPQAGAYLHGFAETGNSWSGLNSVGINDFKRSVGAGLQLRLPIVGDIGFNLGWGLDDLPNDPDFSRSQPMFQVVLGRNIGKL